jgi:(2S)-methylsuccinyl-CoA dehydrogenase
MGKQFDRAVRALADKSHAGGRFDNALFDGHQSCAYELAVIHAELAAAGALLDGARSALDRSLATVFAADALQFAVERLDGVFLGLGVEGAEMAALRSDPDYVDARAAGAQPGFLAELGARIFAGDDSFGQVQLEEDVELARASFARFARDVVAPLAEDIHRGDMTVPEDLLQPMREMGAFGLSIPESYGGFAANDSENNALLIAVTEALSHASLAAAGSLITRPEILSRALLAGGTEAQKRKWLPGIAAGDPLCAIAITEPDYGSDVAGLRLRGTKVEGGWQLNGAKTWCTFAGKAQVLMAVTRTDPDLSLGHRGLSLLLVEKPSFDGHEFRIEQPGGGVLAGRAIPTIGYRGMHSFELAFEDFFVPDANVIGEEGGLGRGFYLTMAGMVGGRLQTAGRALGVMRAALDAAIEYSGQRKVFGDTLGSRQLTQVKLARMAARYAACRHLAYGVGRKIDQGGGTMAASLVKLIACRAAEGITREALQIHGGMGYAEETAVSRYWLDARVLSIFEGAEETLAIKVIARDLVQASHAGADD